MILLNWIVGNLENALGTWNSKLSEIWLLISQSPTEFKGRSYLGGNCKHIWRGTSYSTCTFSIVLFRRNNKNLSEALQR